MRRLVVGTACLIAACFAFNAPAQDPAKKPDNEIKVDSPVYPLKEGNKWVYALGKKEVTITVGRRVTREIVRKDDKGLDKNPEAVRCFQLHIVSEDKKLTEVHGVVNEGVYRFEAAGKVIAPPLCFFNFKSAAWDCKSDSVSGTFTRKGEAVTVPAFPKPMPAFKISCPDFKMGEQTMSIDYWFVETYGMVKQRIKLENHDEVVLELKEYQPAK